MKYKMLKNQDIKMRTKKYEPKYWSGKGKYQKEYDLVSDKLVPAVGNADTPQGELLRQMQNYYYDCFNNGGCNDRETDALQLQNITVPHNVWRPCEDTNTMFREMDKMADTVIKLVIKMEAKNHEIQNAKKSGH